MKEKKKKKNCWVAWCNLYEMKNKRRVILMRQHYWSPVRVRRLECKLTYLLYSQATAIITVNFVR